MTMKTQSEQMVALATRLGVELKAIKTNIGSLSNLTTQDKSALVLAINETVSSIAAANATLTEYATQLAEIDSKVSTNTSNISSLSSSVSVLDSAVATHASRLTAVEGEASTNADSITAANSAIATVQTTLATVQSNLEALTETVNTQTSIDDTAVSTEKTYSSSKITSEITAAKTAVKDDLLGGAGAAYDTLKELADLITTNGDAIASLQAIAAGHVKFDAAQTLTDDQKAQARTNIGAADASTVSGYGTRLTAVEEKASTNATDIATAKESITTVESSVATLQSNFTALQEQVASSTNIDDTQTSDTTTYSSKKIAADIASVEESAEKIADAKAAAALTIIETSLTPRVASVEDKAAGNTTAINNLKAAVGDTTVDLVAKFEEALEASA